MTDKEKEGLKWLSELYAAAAQGKTIQVIRFGKWTDCVSFDEFPIFESFIFGTMDDFRIKPEPRKFWVVETPNRERYMFDNPIDAANTLHQVKPGSQIIPVTETP